MATPGVPNFDAGEKNLNPEHQMNKLREQARSGGAGGGRRPPRFGATEASVVPQTETIASQTAQSTDSDQGVSLDLEPDANDKDMEELLGTLQEKGLPAVFKELDRIDNPHIEDDFHRLLVQYRQEGHHIPGLNKYPELKKSLDFVLFKVLIPELSPDEPGGSLEDICARMEQLYQSVIPFLNYPDFIFFKEWRQRRLIQKDHFTMEIAQTQAGEDATFYMAVPRSRQSTFERQIYSNFPRARLSIQKDDYNIFNEHGETAVAYLTLYRPAPLPIRTAKDFKHDPLNALFAAFSKMSKEGEGAAVQISLAGAGEHYMKRVQDVLNQLKAGDKSSKNVFQENQYLPYHKWWSPRTWGPGFMEGARDFLSEKGDDKKDEKKYSEKNSSNIETVTEKLKSIIVGVNIRIVASARTKDRAEAILREFEQAFGQYENPVGGNAGNTFRVRRPKNKKEAKKLIRSVIFRTFDRGPVEGFIKALFLQFFRKVHRPYMYKSPAMPMNLSEVATVFHLAVSGGVASKEANTAGAKLAPAVAGLPESGMLLGKNVFANVETPVYLTEDDRLRHIYVIGQTGTGKTTLLKNMILQDIEDGKGVCFIDPHGVDVQEIMSRIPKERYDDLIYFDPAYTERPMGLNMLEYDPRYPEQKTFVVDEMFKIFKKLYGDVPEAFGPIFEQYFRNAAGLVVEDPETGSTLLDISRVLSDEDFRRLKLSRSQNSVINHFWEEIAEQVRGEGDIRNVVPYITSKFDIFIANEIMRPIIGQQKSAFNFKEIMDNEKILLVNLSKGRLGDQNANLLGLIIVGKIMMAALARSEDLHKNPPPFYLYMDEFQNITTDTIATILSEARKYKLSLTIAHQYIKQIDERISKAVFGNVGSSIAFRIGPEDADFFKNLFGPTFSPSDMIKIDNHHAYAKILANGKPHPPFSLETYPFNSGDFAQIDALKQLSYHRYGRPRDAIDAEVKEKYEAMRKF